MRALNSLKPEFTRLCPAPALRNPDIGKVKIPDVSPSTAEVVQDVYTGAITDIATALQNLDARLLAAREQAIKEAVAAGAQVSPQDWIFRDWNPLKHYSVRNARR
ncbi:MAG: hypothetical protein HC828_15025 [Blastochloris sp.]|nr:hypothetical protein [Blastochloris sp.]